MSSFPFKDWLTQLRRRASTVAAGAPSLPLPPNPWRNWIEDCTSADGYRREDALKRVSTLPPQARAQAVRFVLARLNDWAVPVRVAARSAAEALLLDELEAAWIAELPAIVALLRARRSDQREFIERVQTFFFSRPARRNALMQALPSFGVAARRWAAQSGWLVGATADRASALAAALTGSDPSVARAALSLALNPKSDLSPLPAVQEALDRIRLPRLRLRVLRHRQAQGLFPPPGAIELALGKHRASREWLCFHADAALRTRLRDACIQALSAPLAGSHRGARGAALETLYLLDPQGCEPWIAALLTDAEPSDRLSAFRLGLKNATSTDKTELALRALADPSPKIRKLAARALRRGDALCDTNELLALAQRHPETWPQVLSGMSALGAIQELRALLQLAAQTEAVPARVQQAMHQADARVRRSVYAPTAAESAELAALWANASAKHPGIRRTP